MKRYNIYRKTAAVFLAAALIAVSFAKPAYAGKGKNAQYWPAGPQIVSEAGIVVEASTGTILYEKNSQTAHYPASITKIMTALLAIENSSMDEVVTFSHDSVYKTEGSGIARDVGEQMTMEWCLYGMMLASSNECAYAIGEHVAGSMEEFVRMMNERAAALGCKSTQFTNCNGLPDEQHYTSAYDMALIAREAYQNETFRILCGTKTYTIPFTNKHTDEETYLQNHHQMLYPLKTRKYLYDYCLGGKTGYTMAANSTLVTYAEKDGMTLICVTLNAPGSGHYEDTRALFDFCFDNFKEINVLEHETAELPQGQARGILGNHKPFASLDASSVIVLPITAEFKDAKPEIVYEESGEDILGSVRYTYAGRMVGGANIVVADASVEPFEFHEKEDEKPAEELHEKQKEAEEQNETKEKESLQIDLRMVLIALSAVLAAVGLILIIWKISDNFYKIRRKFKIGGRTRSPYKTIKKNKMWKKHRKWF